MFVIGPNIYGIVHNNSFVGGGTTITILGVLRRGVKFKKTKKILCRDRYNILVCGEGGRK